MSEVLILGLGNVLMEDEGVGVRAVELLQSRYHLPESVEVIDGGTSGTEMLEPMRGREHLIIADAVQTGDPPGTLVRLSDDQVPAFFQTKISNHQVGLSDLLAVLQVSDEAPRHITIIGMVPRSLRNVLGLCNETLEGLEQMVQMLLAELRSIGVEARERSVPLRGFWAEKTTEAVSLSPPIR